jgi:gliding motility-associated-like protein
VNATTNTVVNTIQVGGGPSALSVSPDGSRLYVVNTESASVSVINTATDQVITTIPVGSYPYGIVVSPDGKTVYVTDQASNAISVIDAATNTVNSTITLSEYAPWGISISPDGAELFVADYLSNSLSIIKTSSGAVKTVEVGTTPIGVSMSSKANLVYVANFGAGTVSVVNVQTATAVATIPVGASPTGATISPDGTRVYITNTGSNTVSVINTATNQVIATIPVGAEPEGISVSPDGSLVYVMNTNDNTMSVINTSSNSVAATSSVNNGQYSIGNFVAGCSPVKLTITVNPAPSLSVTNVTGTISACAGSPSASPLVQQFSVSGRGLTAGPLVTAPSGFEVSLSPGGGYGNSVKLTTTSNPQSVYVRSAASAPAGTIVGNIIVTASGTQTQNVAVSGVVNTLTTVNPVQNQEVTNGSLTNAINFSGTGNPFTWVNDTPAIGLAGSGSGSIPAFLAVNSGSTPLVATVTVTPKAYPLAYISNYADGTVSVINTVTNQVVTTIKVGNQPTGVSVAPDNETVYVADDADNAVAVINTTTNTVVKTITVGLNPPSLMVTPDGKALWVLNANSSSVSVVNTATNAIVKTIPLAAIPVNIAISKDGGKAYITDFASNVEVISVASGAAIATIPVGQEPLLLAVSPNGQRVYVANYQSGDVSVINTATNTVLETITVGSGAEGVVVSADGSTVYITNRNSNTLSVISTVTNTVTQTIPVDQGPAGVALNAAGSLLYVENIDAQDVSVINTATNTVVSTIPVGNRPISTGNFIEDKGNCDGMPVTFTITVYPTAVPPTITASGAIAVMNTIYGTASPPSSFTVSASSLTTGILVKPPAGFEVSTDGINFSNSLTVGTTTNIPATTVYIRLSAMTPIGNYSGNVVLSATGAGNVNINVPNSVVKPAALIITANDNHKAYGLTLTSAVLSDGFTATGLQNNETVGTVSISYGPGNQAGDPVAIYNSSVFASLASGGTFKADNYTISYIAGAIVVDATPLIITANNQNKIFGTANPALTLTYAGFENNEDASALNPQPTITTSAITTSPVAKYPITVAGAVDNNYTITYIPGILTILPAAIQLDIPNTFTPNGDGINDTWAIKNLDNYPKSTVNVFNRWGQSVFSSIGYPSPWDGSYKGNSLPSGTYYYIIDPKTGSPVFSGWLTIIK